MTASTARRGSAYLAIVACALCGLFNDRTLRANETSSASSSDNPHPALKAASPQATCVEDLTITGEPVANLFAASSGSDADWVVKLTDVYAEVAEPKQMGGFEFMLAEEVFRARYRESFEKPQAVVPGKVTPYYFSLRSRDHTFKAGHRIMVQVQSSWFPLIDRNPQSYVPSIYEARESDFRASRQSVYRSAAYPSHISLPVNLN